MLAPNVHYVLLMKEVLSTLNVASLVRSGVVLVLGAPLLMGVGNSLSALTAPSPVEVATRRVQAGLVEPCIDYMFAKNDSKLEREAKTELDEAFGGQVDYSNVCGWVFGM